MNASDVMVCDVDAVSRASFHSRGRSSPNKRSSGVHGRQSAFRRVLRAGRGRHPLPRRDQRHADGSPRSTRKKPSRLNWWTWSLASMRRGPGRIIRRRGTRRTGGQGNPSRARRPAGAMKRQKTQIDLSERGGWLIKRRRLSPERTRIS
jgi:hypothetical protein